MFVGANRFVFHIRLRNLHVRWSAFANLMILENINDYIETFEQYGIDMILCVKYVNGMPSSPTQMGNQMTG